MVYRACRAAKSGVYDPNNQQYVRVSADMESTPLFWVCFGGIFFVAAVLRLRFGGDISALSALAVCVLGVFRPDVLPSYVRQTKKSSYL
jgi:hypothetical protein